MKPIYKCSVCGAYTEESVHCGRPARLLLDGARRTRLSKLMSFLLRHMPSEAGLSLDESGWVGIDELVYGIKNMWRNKHLYHWLTPEHVMAVAMLDPKGRFEIDRDRIRARYGHSRELGLKLSYPEDKTSSILYHGSTIDKLSRILREGIKPIKRQYVHLSISLEDACDVGRRHGSRPVVLIVSADCLRRSGFKILCAGKNVRLVDYVPPRCIDKYHECR